MNALLSNNKNHYSWIGDGSDNASLSVNDGEESCIISFSSANRGTPFNIRLDDDDTLTAGSSSFYYQVEIVEIAQNAHLAAGVVTKEEFQPGWKTCGMFYNGNLTNGSAGLTIGFGNVPNAAGDTVGVYLQQQQRHNDNDNEKQQVVKVIFYLNGRCLGTGFQVDNASGNVFYPCLHVDGRAVVKFSVPTTETFTPTITDREPSAQYTNDAYSGDWKLLQAFQGPELEPIPLPDNCTCILTFHAVDASTYRLSIKVGNIMNTIIKLVGNKLEEKEDRSVFNQIQVGNVMSTMMMPPPEIAALERSLSTLLPLLTKMMTVNEKATSGTLVMTGPTAKLECQRYEKMFEPVTNYK